jgi:hypothetical protein
MFSAYTTVLPPSALPPGPGLVAAVDAHAVLAALVIGLVAGAALLLRGRGGAPTTRRLRVVERAAASVASRAA